MFNHVESDPVFLQASIQDSTRMKRENRYIPLPVAAIGYRAPQTRPAQGTIRKRYRGSVRGEMYA
jgi:hypothetical protein